MPRTDCTVTRLSQSLQIGTPPGSGTESTVRKSSTGPYTKPETSTAQAWTFTITKRITNPTYHFQIDKDPARTETVLRNHLVEFYPKEGSLPAMMEENRPPHPQNDNFYVCSMEQCALDLKNPCTTDGHDSIRLPIEPLRSSLSHGQMKRIDTHSSDSGNTFPLASSRTPVLSPANPTETSTPIHLRHSMCKLLNHHPKDFVAQSNNIFATVLNCAPKCPNIIAQTSSDFQITCNFLFYSTIIT